MVYLKGFYEGKLIIGDHAGQCVAFFFVERVQPPPGSASLTAHDVCSSPPARGRAPVVRKVNVAKQAIRQQMIDSGEAFLYCEPEKEVISRSGDSCIVALMHQWYLDYGEPTWREQAKQ